MKCTPNRSEQHIENSREERLRSKNKLKSQIKELNGRVTKFTEEKDQLDKDLNSAKQDLSEKTEEFYNKQAQLTEKEGEVDKLSDQVAQLTGEKAISKRNLMEQKLSLQVGMKN